MLKRMSIAIEVVVALGAVLVVLIHFLHVLVLKPKSLRSKLHKQGIHGPSPHFYFGNIQEMKTLLLQQQQTQAKHKQEEEEKDVCVSISHNWTSNLLPHIHKWRKQYGPTYFFSSGGIQWLMVTDMELVKEIILNTSLNLGKPSYLSKDMGPLLGQGIVSSSGFIWAHQRKIIAPELYPDKVKAMIDQIVDSTNIMVRSLENRIERDGVVSEIKIDEDLRSLSADIIARVCFGSNYVQGKEIFTKLGDLLKLLSKIYVGIPGFRYLPNKNNRQIWRLEKEINSNISKLVKQRQEEGREQDLLQMILEGAKNCDGNDGLLSNSISRDRFIIDNCKTIFFAGHDTTSITASWCLMLLATYQDWQDRARAEVLEVCRNGNPDASMLKSMKTLTMVIQETLRLYPPAVFVTRTAFEDINIKGPTYLFSSGSIQRLMVTDMELVKEIILNTSLNLGKPSYLSKDMGPLLGQGIVSSSGLIWAHQRKIIAPEFYPDKVKAMIDQIVDSTNIMVRSWENRIERDGVVSEIKINEDLQSLSADIIARVCFGSNYVEGKEIFTKLGDLLKHLSKIYVGIPGFRYLPNKNNRQIWRLEKEINSNISKLVKQRHEEGREQDLLQMILEGAMNCDGNDGLLSNSISRDRFIIDNCKTIFFAGHDTTSITASWCLMLLATYQDWQDRARAEVLEVCGNSNPDASMLRSMKTLTMVIQETLRLYPPAVFVTRTAFQDINIKGIEVPKGMNIQIPISILQHDIDLWGPDAHEFNPERFANGVIGSCKIPQAYMPFGIGSRVCPGQHLSMIELKVFLSLILSKFRFSLSSSYVHSPTYRLVIAPGKGVVLNMTRI